MDTTSKLATLMGIKHPADSVVRLFNVIYENAPFIYGVDRIILTYMFAKILINYLLDLRFTKQANLAGIYNQQISILGN